MSKGRRHKQWLISDLHFDHRNMITKHLSPDGSFVRGRFSSPDEMNEHMIDKWNSVVDDHDHVTVMGDVSITRKGLALVKRLRGRKLTLVGGNHDIYKVHDYLNAGFAEVVGCRELADVLITHVPVHPSCIAFRFLGNAHGHIHTAGDLDGLYVNLCVEATNYYPIELDRVVEVLKKKKAEMLEKVGA